MYPKKVRLFGAAKKAQTVQGIEAITKLQHLLKKAQKQVEIRKTTDFYLFFILELYTSNTPLGALRVRRRVRLKCSALFTAVFFYCCRCADLRGFFQGHSREAEYFYVE